MTSLPEFIDLVCRQHGAALMGVVNVTPDSFFDGGLYFESTTAEQRIDRLLAEGADIIDIGGESTRPGAEPISAEQQIERTSTAIRHAVDRRAIVSIDTTLPEVADRALSLGARIINDVSCLASAELAAVARKHGAALIVMHSRGSMTEMPGFSKYAEDGYEDVVEDIAREWKAAQQRALAEGLDRSHLWFDPGLGFHKSAAQSLELLRRLGEFQDLGVPLCVGASRKSFIGSLDGSPAEQRLGGTVAACLHASSMGAQILRVHDVSVMRQALLLERALKPHSNKSRLNEGDSFQRTKSERMGRDA